MSSWDKSWIFQNRAASKIARIIIPTFIVCYQCRMEYKEENLCKFNFESWISENWSKFLTAEAANMTENNFQNIQKHSFYSYQPDKCYKLKKSGGKRLSLEFLFLRPEIQFNNVLILIVCILQCVTILELFMKMTENSFELQLWELLLLQCHVEKCNQEM